MKNSAVILKPFYWGQYIFKRIYILQKAEASYLIIRLKENLIILREGDQEDDWSDIFKTMDPLPSLRSLATHIYHPGVSIRIVMLVNTSKHILCSYINYNISFSDLREVIMILNLKIVEFKYSYVILTEMQHENTEFTTWE